MSLRSAQHALNELRTTLNEQESKLEASANELPEADLKEKRGLFAEARMKLATLEDFLYKFYVATDDGSNITVAAGEVTPLILGVKGLVHDITTMTTAVEYQTIRFQLQASQLEIAELKYADLKL